MGKKLMKRIAVYSAVACTFALTAPMAMAQEYDYDANVTAIKTSASTLQQAVFPIVVASVGFGVLIALVKMVKRK